MDTQVERKGGLANSLPLQLAVLIVVALIIVGLAWKYLW